jgi:hypothetical protein
MKKNLFEEYGFTSFEVSVFEINETIDHDLMYTYDIIGYGADGIYAIEGPDYVSTVGNKSYRERTVVATAESYDEIINELTLLTGSECSVDEYVSFFVWHHYKSNSDNEQTTGMFAIRKDGRIQEIDKIANDFKTVWARKALPNDGPEWFHENQFQLKDYPVYRQIRQAYVQLLTSGKHVDSYVRKED